MPHPFELEGCRLTAAAEAVARREGLSKETVRRWVVQAQIDGGQRQGATSEELAEIKDLKAKVRRLEGHNEIQRRASIFCAGELPRHRCFAGIFVSLVGPLPPWSQVGRLWLEGDPP